jgi:hypothetical protein
MRVGNTATPSESEDEYRIAEEPEQWPSAVPRQTSSAAAAWTPAASRERPTKGRTRTATVLRPAEPKSDEEIDPDDFPGPFVDRSAILFPWLYPTWACAIGLAFMTELSVCAIGATMVFFFVIMSGMAFVSIFTFASMVTVCVGLTSYVMAAFEMVLEQTAHGDNRLRRLPGYVWHELLPTFKRVFGAWASSVGVAVGIWYSCRQWLGEWYDIQVLILSDLIVFILFPIFMISNSVEQSFLPIWGLIATLVRLTRCITYFAIFLVVTGVMWIGVIAAVLSLSLLHVAFAVIAAGPLLTIFLLYYAHWLGRVVRQMIALT